MNAAAGPPVELAPPLPVDEGLLAATRGVLRAVALRLHPRLLPWMFLAWAVNHVYVFHWPDAGPQLPHYAWAVFAVEASALVCITLAVLVADELVDRGARRGLSYVLAVALGAAVAAWLQADLRAALGLHVRADARPEGATILNPVMVWCSICFAGGSMTFVYVQRRIAARARARLHRARLAHALARRAMLESQLQAMQARVEPQFLFNTLAQVRDLYEQQSERAGAMLDELIAYLRAALPHLRHSSSTLDKEAELVRAYLGIARAGMGEGLCFDIDVPAAATRARMPAMVLLPLVVDVLARGRASAQGGTRIRIAAGTAAARLHLSVVDNVAGVAPGGQGDTRRGLRERLHALYGDAAKLTIESMPEGGTRTLLDIPLQIGTSADH